MVKKLLLIVFSILLIGGITFGIYISLQKLKNSGLFASNNSLKEFYYGFVGEGKVMGSENFVNIEVIQLSDGKYRLFYHDQQTIKSALSEDGKEFKAEDGVRLNGTMSTTVKLPDGKYRMYFVSGKTLKSALSEDGLKFTPEPGDRLSPGATGEKDSFGIIHPSIIKLTDGSYKLFYDGVSAEAQGPGNWHIMCATSTDGLIWKKDEGVRIPHPEPNEDNSSFEIGDFNLTTAFSPHVMYKNGSFEMYFTAEVSPQTGSGIWLATSTDGLKFTIKDKPVVARQKEFGDKEDNSPQGSPRGVAQDPFILKTDEGERLFYWVVEQGIFSALRKN